MIRATLLLVGTIIGAGIFAVPAMIGAWGILPSTFAFVVLTALMTGVHLYYAEAILRSRQKGHLIGRATYWLGPWAGRCAGALQSLQIFGSSLAYLILGGTFLSLLIPVSMHLLSWQVAFWVLGSFIVLFGLRLVSKAESIMTWTLIGVILLISFIFSAQASHWSSWFMPSTWNGFQPYGVFLFSLLGIVGMSEAAELVEYNVDALRKVAVSSTVISAILTYLYGVTAWVASNGTLTHDASDVIQFLPVGISIIVPLFGFLAVMTSFISGALDLRNILQKDLRASAPIALGIALGVPLILLFLTPRDFMKTVGFVGSFFGAGIAAIVVWMGRAAIKRSRQSQKSGTMLLVTEFFPWAITLILIASGILWLVD